MAKSEKFTKEHLRAMFGDRWKEWSQRLVAANVKEAERRCMAYCDGKFNSYPPVVAAIPPWPASILVGAKMPLVWGYRLSDQGRTVHVDLKPNLAWLQLRFRWSENWYDDLLKMSHLLRRVSEVSNIAGRKRERREYPRIRIPHRSNLTWCVGLAPFLYGSFGIVARYSPELLFLDEQGQILGSYSSTEYSASEDHVTTDPGGAGTGGLRVYKNRSLGGRTIDEGQGRRIPLQVSTHGQLKAPGVDLRPDRIPLVDPEDYAIVREMVNRHGNPLELSYSAVPVWFNTLANCKNVEVTTGPSVAMRKRGRGGIREYTLKIQGSKRVHTRPGEPAAESEIAYHIVRGHFKDFRESGLFGKHHGVYWWDMFTRGDKANGEIRKDYELTP